MNVNLEALKKPGIDIGVPGGAELLAFSEALISVNKDELDQARTSLENVLGMDSVPAASAIAANFSKNDRIANGLGIPHDSVMFKATSGVRQHLGLDKYRSAVNTLKYFSSD